MTPARVTNRVIEDMPETQYGSVAEMTSATVVYCKPRENKKKKTRKKMIDIGGSFLWVDAEVNE
jgi:hypothetical protein